MVRYWGRRIGYLTPRHYYYAIANALGSRLVVDYNQVSHQQVKSYITEVSCGNRTFNAYVTAGNPAALIRMYKPPVYVVNFDMAVVPSLEGYNRFDLEYRLIVDGKIESKFRAGQFQVDILITSVAETRTEAYCMLSHLFKRLPQPSGILWVRDSLDVLRPFSYTLASVDDATEIGSLYERYVAFVTTLTLFCAIDYWEKVHREDFAPIDEVIVRIS